MVRVEEFVNAFDYGYSAPRAGSLGIELACAPSPFGRDLQNCYLLRVAIKAREPSETRRPMILTAVVDTSGSMSDGRLALVKEYLTSVVGLLRAEDRLGIVEFSSHAKVVCAHLSGDRREALRRAINGLRTSDRTNAEAGMNLGYEQARAAYRKDANNRVLLFSDGVANVGSTDAVSILAGVELGRGDGVCLSTIGVGTANYSDVLMEQLADKGMGAYSYLACADQIASAFRGGLERRLDVAAQDARIQVAFNAEVVKSYRLIGYDNRQIADHELKVMNHKGAVISPGQEVTALYEVKLVDDAAGELCNATLRWKEPSGGEIHELAGRIATSQIIGEWNDAPDNLRLAACVAEFGELLKQSFWAKGSNFKEVRAELQKVPKQRAADLLDILALLETP